MNKIHILGIKIDNITHLEAIKLINSFILLKKPSQVVTVNSEFIMTAQKDEEFKQVLNSADLSVPDGAGLLFVSRYFLKSPIKERITGIDLVQALSEFAAKKKYPVYFLGGKQGVAEKTAEVLKKLYPNLIVAGADQGQPDLGREKFKDYRELRMTDLKPSKNDPNLETVKKIRRTKAKILFVAYGAPKQDKFIYKYKKLLDIPVMMGVGGAFDFIAGKVTRAPKWVQIIWMEWLWRLIQEPWRLNRIITATIRFPLTVIKDKLTKRVN